jgi:aspartate 1-decarboxylase
MVDSHSLFGLESRPMLRRMLKSKIHRATVTDANVEYEGSITIDAALMKAADIRQYEEVHIWNIGNGERLVTYAIPGETNSGTMCINGAAARRVHKGDTIIVSAYAVYPENELSNFEPRLVFVNSQNRIAKK